MSLLWGTGKRLCCCVVAAIACSGTNTTLAEDSPGAVSLQFGDATYNWLVGEDGTTNYHDTGYEFTDAAATADGAYVCHRAPVAHATRRRGKHAALAALGAHSCANATTARLP